MLVDEILERAAGQRPDKTALIVGGRRFTYAELEHQSNRLAHALVRAGLARRDRVAIYLDNSVETVVSLFAVLKAGGAFVIVNPQAKADQLARILSDCAPFALIAPAAKMPLLEEVQPTLGRTSVVLTVGSRPDRSRLEGLTVLPYADLMDIPVDAVVPPPKKHIDLDLAALVYTSGSTGGAKGVMLSHGNVLAATESITTYLKNSADDIILNALPLAFTYGLGQVMTAFHAGATLVLEQSFTYPAAIVDAIERERVTGLPLVPTAATLLLQIDLAKHAFPHLRYITSAAAALSTAKIGALQAAFPQTEIYVMYGQTECQRASYLPPAELARRPESVGRGMPNADLCIVDDMGRPVCPGEVGELVVRGAHVMRGYWNNPEATARVLRPGRFPGEQVLYTGDLFRMDDEGYLYFVERKDDIVKTRGEKVAPREVEETIARLAGVAEVAVYGVPDDVLGEAVVAAVTLETSACLSIDDVRRHCRRHLVDYMVPKFVDIRESLPVTTNGKVSRRQLRGGVETSEGV